jgi:septal ring factor EnvC (AmiA/AmiB activator)
VRRTLVLAILVGAALPTVAAIASRPVDALKAERAAAELEVRDLERRMRSLEEQAKKRREAIRTRVRALYKLSSGGYLRLLLGAEDAADLSARHAAVKRILQRDFAELEALRDEARLLESDQARHAEALARAAAIESQLASSSTESRRETRGFAARRGNLLRPVPGVIAHSFGPYKEPAARDGDGRPRPGAATIELVRRGVEMRTTIGHLVYCVAPGTVRHAGELPGVGLGVIVDHGDGWMSLVGGLRNVRVSVGDRVHEGTRLGEAKGVLLYFELAHEGTPVNPMPWMRPPTLDE